MFESGDMSITKWTSSTFHWKLTCSCNDIAETLLSWRQTPITDCYGLPNLYTYKHWSIWEHFSQFIDFHPISFDIFEVFEVLRYLSYVRTSSALYLSFFLSFCLYIKVPHRGVMVSVLDSSAVRSWVRPLIGLNEIL